MLSVLIYSQLHQNEKMLARLFDGVADSDLDFQPTPLALSLREHIHHLSSACEAVIALFEGREYDWDSFTPLGNTCKELLSQFRSLRLKAIPAGETITPEIAEMLSDYLILHEAYHIGQMALARHELHPDWDSLVLYT